ncbi:MAG: glycosyltransferase family 9 protein [Ignavibacteria bacterium]|nr:glycosyltransferase family 9 protein [Ignavibacteria bacterium]
MNLLKALEVSFRRMLIRLLRGFSRRSRPLPTDWDFDSSKFLFVRQDRIGDVLVSTPLFHAIKKRYPKAVLDVVLSPNNVMAIGNEQLVRTRWVYRKNPIAAIALIRRLRRQKYDFVIDLMDNPSATSTLLVLTSGGSWTIGLEKSNAYAYDIVVPLLSRTDVHIVERIAAILTVFGIEPIHERLQIRYETTKESDRRAEDLLRESRASTRQVVAINISAGSETRFWGIENYKSLLKKLRERIPTCSFLLLHKATDGTRAREIASAVPNVLVPPKTSFDEFAALIKHSDILITPDTAAVHLAAAFDIPSIVLYVQSDPTLRIWEPYGSLAECLVTPVDDLTTISVGQVVEAFERLQRRMESQDASHE